MTNHFLQETPRRAGRTKDGLMTARTTLDIPALDKALDDLRLRIVAAADPGSRFGFSPVSSDHD